MGTTRLRVDRRKLLGWSRRVRLRGDNQPQPSRRQDFIDAANPDPLRRLLAALDCPGRRLLRKIRDRREDRLWRPSGRDRNAALRRSANDELRPRADRRRRRSRPVPGDDGIVAEQGKFWSHCEIGDHQRRATQGETHRCRARRRRSLFLHPGSSRKARDHRTRCAMDLGSRRRRRARPGPARRPDGCRAF